jgi:hypothetical protein
MSSSPSIRYKKFLAEARLMVLEMLEIAERMTWYKNQKALIVELKSFSRTIKELDGRA